MKNLKDALVLLGFSNKEIKIYIVLLTRKSLTESELGRMVKMPRTTIAPILRKLEKREFVERAVVKNHKEWRVVELGIIRERFGKIARLFE